jgi:uncharacterized pyridoxal phosphate-containing UPF0001 family protein
MDLVLHRGVLGRHAEGVPAHRVQHVEAAGALVARDDVAHRVVAHVAHVDAPRRIGEHFEHVVLSARIVVPVAGLMCIPPADEPPGPHFALLQKLAGEAELPMLSMGMSSDFETAIGFGATHVRVGSALFGGRPPADASA